MGVSRACQPCKAAKAKCDLVRPSCTRCTRRRLSCFGYPADPGLVFLDENARAQRNSERARRTASAWSAVLPGGVLEQQHPSHHATADIPSALFRRPYPWLSHRAVAEVPGPLKRDLESRAVERFFVNWVLHPSNGGMSPGYMHDLPTLYLSSAPESVLWLVIRAMAFADMRDARTGDAPFYVLARRHYGACLASMREVANDEQNLVDDRVLAALLFIDCFELIYLARNWKYRPHDGAIRHILRERGEAQLYDQTKFALWNAAYHRLQVHQILLREEPHPDQAIWLSKLNTNQTDLHLSADLLQMNVLIAATKKLTHAPVGSGDTAPEIFERARALTQSIEDFIESIESWTAAVNHIWKPETVEFPDPFGDAVQMRDAPNVGIPSFTSPAMLSYRDLWLVYLWNLHAASQIVLRESLSELIIYSAGLGTLGSRMADAELMERVEREREAVEKLSSGVIRSFPLLMGFTDTQPHEPRWSQHGKMAGRYFCIFTMWIVSQAELTPPSHKATAVKVLDWITMSHSLA